MTRGISEERLREILNLSTSGTEFLQGRAAMLLELIHHECKELNPWLPIESAPKDRPIHLFYPADSEWSESKQEIETYEVDPMYRQPTHWQELPEDLK